jgi:hypothetical protein
VVGLAGRLQRNRQSVERLTGGKSGKGIEASSHASTTMI